MRVCFTEAHRVVRFCANSRQPEVSLILNGKEIPQKYWCLCMLLITTLHLKTELYSFHVCLYKVYTLCLAVFVCLCEITAKETLELGPLI